MEVATHISVYDSFPVTVLSPDWHKIFALDYFEMDRLIEDLPKLYSCSCASSWFSRLSVGEPSRMMTSATIPPAGWPDCVSTRPLSAPVGASTMRTSLFAPAIERSAGGALQAAAKLRRRDREAASRLIDERELTLSVGAGGAPKDAARAGREPLEEHLRVSDARAVLTLDDAVDIRHTFHRHEHSRHVAVGAKLAHRSSGVEGTCDLARTVKRPSGTCSSVNAPSRPAVSTVGVPHPAQTSTMLSLAGCAG